MGEAVTTEVKTTDLLDEISAQRNAALNELALANVRVKALEREVLRLGKELAKGADPQPPA
jgi:hypothetical protein